MRLKNLLVREVRNGEMIPRGWGIAYRSWHRSASTAMPIPLNMIVGILRWLWHSCLRAPCAWNDEQGRCLSRWCPRSAKKGEENEWGPR